MRSFVPIAALVATAGAAASPGPATWGKAGVSLDQYRSDALACGRSGYYLDVSGTEAARTFRAATDRLRTNEADLSTPDGAGSRLSDSKFSTVVTSQQIVNGTQPERRCADVRRLMQGTVDDCLSRRGYVRFRLTPDQARSLARYRVGSDDRRRFFHRLASDPAILPAQATTP